MTLYMTLDEVNDNALCPICLSVVETMRTSGATRRFKSHQGPGATGLCNGTYRRVEARDPRALAAGEKQ